MTEGGTWPKKTFIFIWELWLNWGCEEETTMLLFMILRVTSEPPETLAPGEGPHISVIWGWSRKKDRGAQIIRSWTCKDMSS